MDESSIQPDPRERRRVWLREYRAINSKRLLAYKRAWNAKRPEKYKAAQRQYYLKYRDKALVHRAVQTAIKNGRLIRPDRCQLCERQCKVHAHHHLGYEAENIFNVQWLCSACHGKAHWEMRGNRGTPSLNA